MQKKDSVADELKKLGKLKKDGTLTEEEFNVAKKKLIASEKEPLTVKILPQEKEEIPLHKRNIGCGTVIIALLCLPLVYLLIRYAYPLVIGGVLIFLLVKFIETDQKYKTIGIVVLVIASLIGMGFLLNFNTNDTNSFSTNNQTTQTPDPVPVVKEKKTKLEYQLVKTLTGKANQETESFDISSDKVKIVARTWGSNIGSYSGVHLESEEDSYLGAGLSISTEGKEEGTGETIYRGLEKGKYFISVISGINWEVNVYQEVEVPIE